MDNIALQTLLISIVVGISCGLLGVFLILRKSSMMIDAISHTVLLGIVIAFMFVGDLSSPWIMIGSTIMGVVTVILIEILANTQKVSLEGSTGVIFPFLFSLAVILITTCFRSTHLDTHAISGNLEFAAFEQITLFNSISMSKTLLINLIVLFLIVLITILFFKQLKLSTFDKALAKTLGMKPLLIHYLFMTLVSFTTVTSFNAVGSILVIAMMIGPAATALIMTKDLKTALITSALVALFNASSGYFLAMEVLEGNVNIASTIATVTFLVFLLVWIFQPKHGVLTKVLNKYQQEKEFEVLALIVHIFIHQQKEKDFYKLKIDEVYKEFNWSFKKMENRIQIGLKNGWFIIADSKLALTLKGKDYLSNKLKEYS